MVLHCVTVLATLSAHSTGPPARSTHRPPGAGSLTAAFSALAGLKRILPSAKLREPDITTRLPVEVRAEPLAVTTSRMRMSLEGQRQNPRLQRSVREVS